MRSTTIRSQLRKSALIAVALSAIAGAAEAQFWATPPNGSPARSPAASEISNPPPYSTAPSGEGLSSVQPPIHSANASGRAESLGGSGDTGPDSVGVLPERDTDFDRRTWRDTAFPVVVKLMAAIPNEFDSAAEHELAKNLLVSIADAPPGDDGGSQLLGLRVRKLLAMGNVDDAAALARAATSLQPDEALAHDEVEAELLAGQVEAACIDLRAFASILSDPASAAALLLCRQRAGETIEGGMPPVAASSLGYAARIAGLPIGVDPASASPGPLVAMAQDASLAPEQRLEAAFYAGRASAMSGEALASIFTAIPAPAGALGDPPTSGAAAAALYRAISQEGDTSRKLALAESGLLSPAGIADKIGVAMVDPLRNLQPEPELGVLAARFAMAFYTLGDIEAATPWADLAVASGAGVRLWPYRVLLKKADPIDIGAWEQQSGLDRPHLARVLTILSAFGITNPPPPNMAVSGDRKREPDFADLIAIDRAAADGHVGETALRALALLGKGGPSQAHPLALKRALADLDAALLHNEAHALAFEAITATLTGH